MSGDQWLREWSSRAEAAALVCAAASVGDADEGCGRWLISVQRSAGRCPVQSAAPLRPVARRHSEPPLPPCDHCQTAAARWRSHRLELARVCVTPFGMRSLPPPPPPRLSVPHRPSIRNSPQSHPFSRPPTRPFHSPPQLPFTRQRTRIRLLATATATATSPHPPRSQAAQASSPLGRSDHPPVIRLSAGRQPPPIRIDIARPES
jgi:hypothetical protein